MSDEQPPFDRALGTLGALLAERGLSYAAVDQGPDSKHFEDLVNLGPSNDELLVAARWARSHDPSEGFRDQLLHALRDLGVPDAQV